MRPWKQIVTYCSGAGGVEQITHIALWKIHRRYSTYLLILWPLKVRWAVILCPLLLYTLCVCVYTEDYIGVLLFFPPTYIYQWFIDHILPRCDVTATEKHVE
jgi:hypothetical protein